MNEQPPLEPFLVISLIAVAFVGILTALSQMVEGDEMTMRLGSTAAALAFFVLCGLPGRTLAKEQGRRTWIGQLTLMTAAAGIAFSLLAIWVDLGNNYAQLYFAAALVVAAILLGLISLVARGKEPQASARHRGV